MKQNYGKAGAWYQYGVAVYIESGDLRYGSDLLKKKAALFRRPHSNIQAYSHTAIHSRMLQFYFSNIIFLIITELFDCNL